MRFPANFYHIVEFHANQMTNMIFHDAVARGCDPSLSLPRVIPKFAYDYTLATGKVLNGQTNSQEA